MHIYKKYIKIKIKGKSKCAICSTEKKFIHEIEGKNDIESESEVYLQFFTDSCYKITWRITV